MTGKQPVIFTGSYSPLEDEILCIQNFVLSDDLKDAFRNPVIIEPFIPNKTDMQDIKAICIGYCENTGNDEKFIAGFQKFRKDQYITINKIRLLYDGKTFNQDQRAGIAISDYIDCFYDGANLIFNSYTTLVRYLIYLNITERLLMLILIILLVLILWILVMPGRLLKHLQTAG